METHQSLEWLIKECGNGNANTFRLLFEETKDDLFRFIRFRVGTREDALDILQDTFVDLWKSLKEKQFEYSSDEELLGFMCLIARRKIIKLYRKGNRTVSLEDLADVISEDSKDEPGELAIILKALQTLPDSDKEVVELHCFEGLSFREIARLLDKGESAVKVRYHRAMAKLKHDLGYEKEE